MQILGSTGSERYISGLTARATTTEGRYKGPILNFATHPIGVSTAFKVWSNTYDRIPELSDWCDRLAQKIASGRVPMTGSRLDLLSPGGGEIVRVPAGIIAMTWAIEVYRDPPPVLYHRADGTVGESNLLDCDLVLLC